MYTQIPVQLWMQLDKDVRELLAKEFDIKRTGVAEIRDQTVISDYHSNQDLKEAITLEKMNAFIGSEETFPRAWEITCSKARGILHPPINMNPVIQMADEPKEVDEIIETKTKTYDNKKSK